MPPCRSGGDLSEGVSGIERAPLLDWALPTAESGPGGDKESWETDTERHLPHLCSVTQDHYVSLTKGQPGASWKLVMPSKTIRRHPKTIWNASPSPHHPFAWSASCHHLDLFDWEDTITTFSFFVLAAITEPFLHHHLELLSYIAIHLLACKINMPNMNDSFCQIADMFVVSSLGCAFNTTNCWIMTCANIYSDINIGLNSSAPLASLPSLICVIFGHQSL